MDQTSCPCCGDEMEPTQVVCWTCWRESDRLTPGDYVTDGEAWTITQADAMRYQAMRIVRLYQAGERELSDTYALALVGAR